MPAGRYVFMAAIGRYADPAFDELAGVRSDADHLAGVLKTHGDRELVRLFRACDDGATKDAVTETLDSIARLAGTRSQIFIFLAGHGAVVPDEDGKPEYFFLPWDASPENVRDSGISTRDIGSILGRTRALEIVVILDFCHSGGLPSFEWIAPMLEDPRRSCCIMAASHRSQVAAGRNGSGYFTAALTNAFEGKGIMTDGDGRVSAQKAWSYAAEFAEGDAARDRNHQRAVSYMCGSTIFVTRPVRTVDGSADRVVRVYPTPGSAEFCRDIRRLIGSSRRMLFVGTGLSVLNEPDVRTALVSRAREPGVTIDICLANPYNPSVQDRLIEEEMFGQRAPTNLHGLKDRFQYLLHEISQLQKLQLARKMDVRLFEHYPTAAILILDKDIFTYRYGYHELGSRSPVTWLRDDGGADATFLRSDAERTLRDSVSARMVVKALREPGYCDPAWTLAAVYIIPNRRTSLYRFGSELIGYDIHGQRRMPARSCPVAGFRDAVGQTSTYGFHITLADALYFATDAAVERVKAELHFLSREFSLFELTDIHLEYPFHGNRKMMALGCKDPSGRAEALHHEIVSRIYRLAISSTYRTRKDRRMKAGLDPRLRLMLQRYRAPYILHEYHPHFTLASNCPQDAMLANELAEQVEARFKERVRNPSLRVRELCLAVKRHGDEQWRIEDTFHLHNA
jgi:Protein of unknown function (DUF1045)